MWSFCVAITPKKVSAGSPKGSTRTESKSIPDAFVLSQSRKPMKDQKSLSNTVFAAVLAFSATTTAVAQDAGLADYFGFDPLEVIKVGRSAGPLLLADMNGDGRTDIVVANNFASRIEVHYQKESASPDDVVAAPRVNEFPEHWRYRRENVSVTHRIDAMVAHDFNGDGKLDIIYGGQPPEIVFLKQTATGTFDVSRKHRVKNLAANRNGFAIANVIGDSRMELLALVKGTINIWTLNGDLIGEPVELSAGSDLVAFMIEDYNGDEHMDIVGILPDNAAPVRMWLAGMDRGLPVLSSQRRFDLPALREFKPVRLAGEKAARLATIERASKRIVLYQLDREIIESVGDRDASLRVFSFTDDRNTKRDHAVVDVDGDGLLDLVATDIEANTLVVYKQMPGKGLQTGESYPSLSDMDALAAGNVDDDPFAELFVLSEKEGVVGRCDVDESGVPFPVPLGISEGFTPVTLNLVELDGKPHLAVVVRSSRQYAIDLLDLQGNRTTVDLGSLSRSPDTVLALDADQDGRTDLLLFTPEKPMTMLQAKEDGTFSVMESSAMGQFGLVKDASAANTAVFDIDGDGKDELLIASRNYTRAVRYDSNPGERINPGWQVIAQINASDSTSKLVSLAMLDDRIFAADKENSRLIVIGQKNKDGDEARNWEELETVNIRGFSFSTIHAGAFAGDDTENILAVGDDGFAIIQLAGERLTLNEVDSWRTADERQFQHELVTGDVNNDGFQDMIALDAGQQMCQIFTFTEAQHMLYATGFKVFESQLFSGGEPREYQPSAAFIGDVTGDGANDIVMLSHDRVLIYPQMTRDEVANSGN